MTDHDYNATVVSSKGTLGWVMVIGWHLFECPINSQLRG
jgi:hypothetical protein